jgi:hypothetical protein
MMYRVFCLSLVSAACCLADLDLVKAEPNLEKRSEKAFKNAHAAFDRARQAFKDGDAVAEANALGEVGQSIELGKQSLDESGKNPRRSPKYFKRAEIELRKLIRRLDNFRIEQSVDDRATVDKLLELGHRIHEELILGIMGKKGK